MALITARNKLKMLGPRRHALLSGDKLMLQGRIMAQGTAQSKALAADPYRFTK
jgi:hypothetical protein